MNRTSVRNAAFFFACSLGMSPLSPALAGPPAAPKPAPPCTTPGMPGPVATRLAQLGGTDRFGCFVDVEGTQYVFKSGRIEAVPDYGPNATYAAVVDAQRIVHLYMNGADPSYPADYWQVRLTFEGSLVNQVKYSSGDGDVNGTYASDILVHPGDRSGTFEIAMQGCFKSFLTSSHCVPWSSATFLMKL